MVLSFVFIALIAAGGFALSYLIENDEPLMARLAAGCVIGSAVFGTFGFLLANAAGLSTATALITFAAVLAPLLIFRSRDKKRRLLNDWNNAKNRLQGKSLRRMLPFVYYLFFFLLFLFFFERVMFVRDGGIFTGGSNNLGDLPFHLGAIFSFTEGANFPPENPNFAGAKFTYPFIADLITAFFVKLGADVKDAMLVQNVAWCFALLVILQRFVLRLVDNKVAARIAPFLLFFSGGLGFIWFFSDYFAQSKSFLEFLNAMPKDYTIGPEYRWGNSLNTLFITQRSLLLGMPLTIVILTQLWRLFVSGESSSTEPAAASGSFLTRYIPMILLGAIGGMLVLIHLHSLLVLFVVCAFLVAFRPYRELVVAWVIFAISVSAVAVPELLWSMSGSATDAGEFISRHFGWDAGETNLIWFWIKNTGIFIPMIALGIYFAAFLRHPENRAEPARPVKVSKKAARAAKEAESEAKAGPNSRNLFLFYAPFVFIFLISNLFKFAPWQWDNIKLLIYWWVGSIPLAAFAVAFLWKSRMELRVLAACLLAVLVLAGSIDVYRVVSGQINLGVFDRDAVEIANAIRTRTPAEALFLNAPTYNTAVVLSGRRSLLRYPGHLSSHGINYGERIADTKTIYSGGPAADSLLHKHGIGYVLLGPEVQYYARENGFAVNEAFFAKYELLTATAKYKIYKIK